MAKSNTNSKSRKVIISLLLVLILSVLVIGYNFYKKIYFPNVSFDANQEQFVYIPTGASFTDVVNILNEKEMLENTASFEWVAEQMKYKNRIKPGKYRIRKNMSNRDLVAMLRSGVQVPVEVVFNNIRTKEELASVISGQLEADSAAIIGLLGNDAFLEKYGFTEINGMALFIPNTYEFYWSTPTNKIFKKLSDERDAFWKRNDRLKKTEDMGLSPNQVYTIASIVEEETNQNEEKGNVASVYINRYHKGMPLGADPTIKFALKDFGLKRIYFKHLAVVSPYNTYRNKGLPPGPICTPSTKTIDAVLNAPKTDYLFFVARSDFKGYHTFSTSYAEHQKNAAIYQKALDELILRKQKAKESL